MIKPVFFPGKPWYRNCWIFLDEFLDFKCTVSMLSGAADGALGSIISKFKLLKNVGFKTFLKQIIP